MTAGQIRRRAEQSGLRYARLLVAVCVVIAGCAPIEPAPDPANSSRPGPGSGTTATSPAGVLIGTVAGQTGPFLVELRPGSGADTTISTESKLIDQFGYTFDPPLSIALRGQPVRFGNSEDVDHHVRATHVETGAVVVNGTMAMGDTIEHRFDATGPYVVRCDIHPAMMALILVVSHPFAAIANNDGEFRIEAIAPGTYELAAWSVAGERILESAVEVRIGATGSLEMAT